jgi:prepilin-type processing-associated H-X9-DG protein
MPIPIDCPCGEKLRVCDELAGQLFRCPGCGRNHEVPTAARLRPEPAAPTVPLLRPPPAAEPTVPRTSSAAKFAIFIGAFVAVGLIGVITLYFVLRNPTPVEDRPRGETGYRSPALRQMNRNNLTQIALALQAYHDANISFPPAAASPRPGAPPVSWRVLILPYLEAGDVYNAWDMMEPWDGPNNRQLWARMPKCYQLPARPHDGTKTYYQVFVGTDTVFPAERGIRLVDITDGSSNTILVAEGGRPVLWCEPVDIPFLASPNGYDPKQVGGYYGRAVNVAMADGSVRSISWDLSPQVFQNVITRADGFPVDLGP